MSYYYLLYATGEDRPGIVAAVTQSLFKLRCNLEDSSMMRLGSEFGVLLIFTKKQKISTQDFKSFMANLRSKFNLSVGIKALTPQQAQFKPVKNNLYGIRLYGPDYPGIVYKVTQTLAQFKFNITDLNTHRTSRKKKAAYILFIEGELSPSSKLPKLRRRLAQLQKTLKTKIAIDPIPTQIT